MWLCICPSVDILRLFGHETSPRSPAPNMHPLAYGADMGVLVSLDAALHHIHRPRCELVNAHHRLYWENRPSLALAVSCTCAMLPECGAPQMRCAITIDRMPMGSPNLSAWTPSVGSTAAKTRSWGKLPRRMLSPRTLLSSISNLR